MQLMRHGGDEQGEISLKRRTSFDGVEYVVVKPSPGAEVDRGRNGTVEC
jgi:hypothetical protein